MTLLLNIELNGFAPSCFSLIIYTRATSDFSLALVTLYLISFRIAFAWDEFTKFIESLPLHLKKNVYISCVQNT